MPKLRQIRQGEVPFDGIGADDPGYRALGRHVADAVMDRMAPGARTQPVAIDDDLAVGLRLRAGDDLGESRFPRSQYAGDAEDFSLAQVERHAPQMVWFA